MTKAELNLEKIASSAKKASLKMAALDTEIKNKTLLSVADNLDKNKELIIKENKKDLDAAEIMVKQGKLTQSLYNRLVLNKNKINSMIQGVKDLAKLDDPVNQTLWAMELDEKLELYRVSCPLGVIGIIFEARPEVVVQIAALAIKSSNAAILKGGKEASKSNEILAKLINEALSQIENFPAGSINLIKTREDVAQMLKMEDYIDLIIPRGGNDLVKYIQSNTKIPVLGHADGICHIYIDEEADLDKTLKLCIDSKIDYPSACNAVETILINEKTAKKLLPKLIQEFKNSLVEVLGCSKTLKIVSDIKEAQESDWSTEYSDKIISIKIVKDILEAIDHINNYGSGHTDCIISENKQKAELFMDLVDSAGVFHNASTRFSDGFRYGLGAEVGISTNKTHARGPVGLEGLVIYKYKLYGNGQIVGEYSKGKPFTHKKIK